MNLLQLQQLVLGRIQRTNLESTKKGLQNRVQATSSSRGSPEPVGHADVIAQATAHCEAGELAQSLSLLTEQLAQDPDNPELRYARALTLSDWCRLRESLEDLRAAESGGFAGFGLQLNLAQICQALGFGEEAVLRARRAVSLDPKSARAHFCLATVVQSANCCEEAIRSYERALELAPERVECLINIASCKLDQKDGVAAEAVIRRATALDGGDQAKSWAILGVALALQERHSEAQEAFDHAEEIEERTGQREETFVHHGFHLLSLCNVSGAIELYSRHLPAQPDPLAHAHYGFSLLTAGRYREGWEQYEFRRLHGLLLSIRPSFGRPAWNGQPLQGKTVLVWAEQGIGDTVQFARFGRLLKSKGATVVLQVRSSLKEFAEDCLGFDRVILAPRELGVPFDYQISTMSIARVLCPDIASIPADVPYLKTDPDRVRYWRDFFGGGKQLKVGVVWAGNPKHDNDRRRSMSLSELAPLWNIDGVRYFSLQKERRDADDGHFPGDGRLVDLADQLHDFRDTAAAIEALDLIIAVDTAVAHVAGALGKPVWVMLPAAADFRWLMNREDSPWYPTMRLFRQQQVRKWDDVVGRVGDALRIAVQSQRTGTLVDGLLPSRSISAASTRPVRCDGEVSSDRSDLSRVTDTRYGVMQYVPDQGDIARSIELYGEWLQPQVDLLGKILSSGATVLEAPCGIGAHVLALAQVIGPTGHLLAYEESPLQRRILLQNTGANKLRSMVTLMVRQLGGSVGRKGKLTPSSTDELHAAIPAKEVETIDELLIQRLDLIKLNDCGEIRAILEGAAETLWRLRPRLFLSLPETGHLAPIVDQAKSFGYRCWRTESTFFNPDNFNRCEVDLFDGRKAAALIAIPEEIGLDIASDGCVEI